MSNISTMVTGNYKNKEGEMVDKVSVIISNVFFAYTRLQKPMYNKFTEANEYSVIVFMDKVTAKEFKKAKYNKEIKSIDTEEFEVKYKFEAPFKGDEQYFVKMTAPELFTRDYGDFKAGEVIPHDLTMRPKVWSPVEGGVEEVTLTTEVGNGSKGKLEFSTYTSKGKIGVNFLSILVEDLVEYVSKEYDNSPKSAFGAVVGGINSDDSQATQRDASAFQIDTEDEVSGGVDEGDIFDEEEDDGFPA
jgi:hypothetical protein